MPFPEGISLYDIQNRLLMDQLNYDKEALKLESEGLINNMTNEQRSAFDRIMDAVKNNISKVFFLNGYGGTGKTYVWNALSSTIRAHCYSQVVELPIHNSAFPFKSMMNQHATSNKALH